MNAAEPLVARLRGTRPALVVDGEATTAGALGARTLGLAAWLRRQGVCPGDRVVMLVPPGPDFAAAFLAIVWLGAVPVLLEPGQAPGAWRARIAACEPRWVVVDPRLPWVWRVPGLTGILARRGLALPPSPPSGRRLSLPRRTTGAVPPVDRASDDEALLVFTSGTTSSPRAVVHTHGNLPAFLRGVGEVVGDLPVGSYLAETPQQIFYAFLLDATCHIVRGQGERRLKRALALLSTGRVEAWFGSPWTWASWLQRGLPIPAGLRTLLLGSAPVTRPFLRELLAAMPAGATARCVYGLTEAGPVCAVDAEEKLAWTGDGDLVGRPLSEVSLRIGTGSLEGRVLVQSPSLAPRTLDGPLGVALDPSGAPPADDVTTRAAERWLDTGDLGALVDGRLALRGRAKDMILRRGVNLYPGVLEPLVLEHVDDAALVGVWDEALHDERVVLAWVGARLPDLPALLGEGAPDHTLRLDTLPRAGRQHKVDKAALRRIARERFAIPGAEPERR